MKRVLNRWQIALIYLLVIFLIPVGQLAQTTEKAAKPAAYVIMLSIDGLLPDYYLKADRFGLKIPNLRKLCKKGSYAEAVESVYPSLTYPAHTTLVTGVKPAQHGIYSNRLFVDPLNNSSADWYWYAKAIKRPTLWSEAHKAGLKTASVGWPVTTGAEIDYLIPEIWQGDYQTSLKTSLENATPGLIDKLGLQFPADAKYFDDEARVQAVEKILSQKPNLLMVHLVELDFTQHKSGPFSDAAKTQLEKLDNQLGRIISAIQQTGITEQTTLVIVSDHGFMKVEKEFHPGVILAKEGFIELGKDGKLKDWKAMPYGEGGATAIMLKNPNDRITEYKVVELFEKLAKRSNSPIYQVIKRDELIKLGANPEAACFLEASPGFEFTTTLTGKESRNAEEYLGSHGYLPSRPEMFASFIISGRGVREQQREPFTKSIHIAPTIAALLGFNLPETEGRPIRHLLTVPIPEAKSKTAGVSK